MSHQDSMWIGADPGGNGNFGLAILKDDGSVRTWCVNCADEAVALVINQVATTPSGFGVDAPLWWSSGISSDRLADQWIRKTYGLPMNQVQAVNQLRGAALAQGMMFVQRVRELFPNARVTETHPKVQLKALNQDERGFYEQFGLTTNAMNEHERDAIISAIAAREGFELRWTNDLSIMRHPSEQNPHKFWLAPIHCFWPEP